MKSLLIKGLLGSLTTMTLVGGLVAYTWEGGNTLTNAKAKIGEYVSSINIFKDNETKLVTKVGELNTQIDDLKQQLANGQGNTEELQAQIVALTSERDALLSEKANLESDLTEAVQKLEEANLQIDSANKQATELQVYIDTLEVVPQAQDISGLIDGSDFQNGTTWEVSKGEYNDGNIRMVMVGNNVMVEYLATSQATPPLKVIGYNGTSLTTVNDMVKTDKAEYSNMETSIRYKDNNNTFDKTITIIK